MKKLELKRDYGYFFISDPCPIHDPNYASVEGVCYFFDTTYRTKEEAKSYCTSNHGKLWEPKTIKKINDVHTKAISVTNSQNWWIGMSDIESEGTFKFDSDGDVFPFPGKKSPWNYAEPAGGSANNCAFMERNKPEIHEYSCNYKFFSICESTSIPPGDLTISKISAFPLSIILISTKT